MLAQRIVEGHYTEGERLRENDLAAELGVSRSPIREAFRILEQDGMIELTPRRGAVIVSYTEESVSDVYDCRAHLSALGAERATSRITSDDLQHLRGLLQQMETAVADNSLTDYLRLNRAFHDYLYERSGNRMLQELIIGLRRRTDRLRVLSLSLPRRIGASLELHRQMIDRSSSATPSAPPRSPTKSSKAAAAP